MKYTIEEKKLAQKLFDAAVSGGQTPRRAIAVGVGLSNPDERLVVIKQAGPEDYLAEARRRLTEKYKPTS